MFNPVFIKDFERYLDPKLNKYKFLFIDNIDNDNLYKERYEYCKKLKKQLDDDGDDDEEGEFYYPYTTLLKLKK